MKRSDFEKPSKRAQAVHKHLKNFRNEFEKVEGLLNQSQDYIAELERELLHAKQENKLLTAEVRRLRGGSNTEGRFRSGSDDGGLFRNRSLDDSFRRVAKGSRGDTPENDSVTTKTTSGPDDDDDDRSVHSNSSKYEVDTVDVTPRKARISVGSNTNTPASVRREDGGDTSGDESTGSTRRRSGNDIVQRLAQRICNDPAIRTVTGFSEFMVVPPMEVRGSSFTLTTCAFSTRLNSNCFLCRTPHSIEK